MDYETIDNGFDDRAFMCGQEAQDNVEIHMLLDGQVW